MSIGDAMERKEAYEDFHERRDARLQTLAEAIDTWQEDPEDQDPQTVGGHYEEVGRLKARLEATQHSLEQLRERGDLQELRDDIDDAISELEEAVAKAAPRYQ